MVSFFARIEIFRFWLKTMDYSKAFSFRTHNSSLEGATELKFVLLWQGCHYTSISTPGTHIITQCIVLL